MAKITAINHVAFAVKDLQDALHNATEILGGEIMMEFESIEDKYRGACVKFGSSIMSYISSDDPDSFISKFVEKHGNGVQHLGLEIDDIEEYVSELEAKGVKFDVPFREVPALGLKIAFLTDPWGTYLELTEGLDKL